MCALVCVQGAVKAEAALCVVAAELMESSDADMAWTGKALRQGLMGVSTPEVTSLRL